jgi:hypothetical protein
MPEVRGQNHDFEYRVFATRKCAFHIAFEQRGERLLGLPLRMLGRKRLYVVEREKQVDVQRLLSPQRAVMIERGDALVRRHKVGLPFLRHLCHEFDDRLFGLAILPGRKRVGSLSCRQATEGQGRAQIGCSEQNSFHCHCIPHQLCFPKPANAGLSCVVLIGAAVAHGAEATGATIATLSPGHLAVRLPLGAALLKAHQRQKLPRQILPYR